MKIELNTVNKQTFDEWSFQQVTIYGNKIVSVKDENKKNYKWVNIETGEEYILTK